MHKYDQANDRASLSFRFAKMIKHMLEHRCSLICFVRMYVCMHVCLYVCMCRLGAHALFPPTSTILYSVENILKSQLYRLVVKQI